MRSVSLLAATLVAAINWLPSPASAATSVPYHLNSPHGLCSLEDDLCTVFFPLVPAGKRFDVQFVSCEVGGNNLEVARSQLGVTNGFAFPYHYLAGTAHPYAGGTQYVISQPVIFSVPGNKRPNIKIQFFATLISHAICALSGQLVSP
jgi:hypothetical protein